MKSFDAGLICSAQGKWWFNKIKKNAYGRRRRRSRLHRW
jgi:hypothetical protein